MTRRMRLSLAATAPSDHALLCANTFTASWIALRNWTFAWSDQCTAPASAKRA